MRWKPNLPVVIESECIDSLPISLPLTERTVNLNDFPGVKLLTVYFLLVMFESFFRGIELPSSYVLTVKESHLLVYVHATITSVRLSGPSVALGLLGMARSADKNAITSLTLQDNSKLKELQG